MFSKASTGTSIAHMRKPSFKLCLKNSRMDIKCQECIVAKSPKDVSVSDFERKWHSLKPSSGKCRL